MTYLIPIPRWNVPPRNDSAKLADNLQGDKAEYHPSVVPSGLGLVGNRYRGFRFALSPAVIRPPFQG